MTFPISTSIKQEPVNFKARKIATFFQTKAYVFVAIGTTSWTKLLQSVLLWTQNKNFPTVISTHPQHNVPFVLNITILTKNSNVNPWKSTFLDARFTASKIVSFVMTTRCFIPLWSDALKTLGPNNAPLMDTWPANNVSPVMLWTIILSFTQ